MSTIYDTGLLSVSIKPKTSDDESKLALALDRLMAEDPTIRVRIDQESREVIVGGNGELHLEIVLDRLRREFDVEATVGRPQVAYREALTRPAEGEMKYARQVDGRGEYAHVRLRLLGAPRGTDYVFVNGVTGNSIPLEFIESVEAGIRESLSRGPVAGHPIAGVRVELFEGSYHDVHSTHAAFKIAGALATVDAVRKAAPVLLEPVMLLQVTIPEEYLDDVTANLVGRHGIVDSRENRDGTAVMLARAPLAGLFGYAADLRQRTVGRGTFKTRFYRYQPCPAAGGDSEDRDSMVGAPLKPRPNLRVSGVALPEPDDRPDDDQDGQLIV